MVLLPSAALAQSNPFYFTDGSLPPSGTNSTFDHAINRANAVLNYNTDSEAVGTVVHESLFDFEAMVLPNGATKPYNAAVVSMFAQDYSFGGSVLGFNSYGMVGWGNWQGNVWGGFVAGFVPNGADGSAIGLENDSANYSSDQPIIGGVNQKIGFLNNCIGTVNCTVAEYIVGWQGHWHTGIRMPQWSVATGGFFFNFDVASMDRLGNHWVAGKMSATSFKAGIKDGIAKTVNLRSFNGSACQMIYTGGLLTSSTC